MSTPPDERAKEVFLAALEVPADRRSAFILGACRGDDDLQAEVESLLAHDAAPDPLMDAPAVTPGPLSQSSGQDEMAAPVPTGRRIGRYLVRRAVASGGMGVVYEAVQDHPHRTVALKVLHRGVASSQALRRFEHEVEILGRLQHPNIAHVHDAGTFDEGDGARPYFAMEFIDGPSLTEHVEAGALGTRERLALFTKICDAVQYAHHRGVIHRDLKPENILVDGHGEPKVLDFGVARATDSDIHTTTLRTDVGVLIGTVPYMSPEQVAGDPHDLDTRSDVYSLGVVLYELLTDRLPSDLKDKTIPEALRIIREDDPAPLSSIDRSLRGDLETIVAKALEKDKERRYESVAQLAADVRRHMSDEPIVARPASVVYQLRKFTRRHQGLVGGVAAAFVVLLVALIIVAAQAVRIRAEAERVAETNAFFESILLRTDLLESEAGGVAPEEIGLNLRWIDVLKEALSRLDANPLSDEEFEATFRYRVGMGLRSSGEIVASRDQLQLALEMRSRLLGEEDPDTLACKVGLASTLMLFFDQRARAEQLVVEVLEVYDTEPGPPDERTLRALRILCWILENDSRSEEAAAVARRAIGILEDSERPLDFAGFLPKAQLGMQLVHLGSLDEAEEWLDAAEEDLQVKANGEHQWEFYLLLARGMLAGKRGQWDEAERSLAAAHRENVRYRGAGTNSSDVLKMGTAIVARWRGRWDEAAEIEQQALDDHVASIGLYHTPTAIRVSRLAYSLYRADRFEEAEERFRLLDRIVEQVPVPDWFRARDEGRFSVVLRTNGAIDEADERLGRALEIASRLSPDDARARLALNSVAWSLWEQGTYDEAEPLARSAVAGYDRAAWPRNDEVMNALDTLACIRRDLGRIDEALALFDRIGSICAGAESPRAVPVTFALHHAETLAMADRHADAEAMLLALEGRTSEVRRSLAALYEDWGKPDEARLWREGLEEGGASNGR